MSKVLAVGDVHQKEWIFDKVDKIADQYDYVVFVGDYTDNFFAASEDRPMIIESLMSLMNKHKNIISICGNHDFCYFDDDSKGLYSGWDPIAQIIFDSKPHLVDFMKSLPQVHEIDGITYSHAGLTDDWDELRHPLAVDGHMWVRPQHGYVYKENQVFGHTPSKTCYEVQKSVWCIDSFSQYRDGSYIGDCTVLEVTDGKKYTVISL